MKKQKMKEQIVCKYYKKAKIVETEASEQMDEHSIEYLANGVLVLNFFGTHSLIKTKTLQSERSRKRKTKIRKEKKKIIDKRDSQ